MQPEAFEFARQPAAIGAVLSLLSAVACILAFALGMRFGGPRLLVALLGGGLLLLAFALSLVPYVGVCGALFALPAGILLAGLPFGPARSPRGREPR